MNRTGLLAATVVMLASSPSFGQLAGVGGMGGGMGGQGMAPGMTMQGARLAGAGVMEVRRSAQIEMDGGQRLSGKIDLRPLIVDGDLGRYVIAPYKIKMIRFLKPVEDVNPVNGPEGNNPAAAGGGEPVAAFGPVPQARVALVRANRGGGNAGGFAAQSATRGKVITTADKEIIGTIHIPTDFRLELDFGTLALASDKLRSITFTDDSRGDKPVQVGATTPGGPNDGDRPLPGRDASLPRYFRNGSVVIVCSPVGDRAALYSLETQRSELLELSGSKEAPLDVNVVFDQNLAALMLTGPKMTRIAVADTASGTWHSQELRKPVEGRAVPIVGSGVVVYNLGPYVYAYGAQGQRWDVAELPEGLRAMPSVGPGTATIESDGHIFTFTGKTGKWNHVDVRALLDHLPTEKK